MRVFHFFNCTLPDNPTHAAAGKMVSSDWNHDHVIEFGGADVVTALGYTPVTNARTVSAGAGLSGGGDLSANRTLSLDLASANVWTATQTVPRLVAATGTITASEPVLDLSQTWNAGGVTFTGIKLNVTTTASAAASLLQDWQVGGTSQLSVRKDGVLFGKADSDLFGGDTVSVGAYFRMGASSGGGIFAMGNTGNCAYLLEMTGQMKAVMRSDAAMGWASLTSGTPTNFRAALDTILYRDAAATLALRNSTNAQTFRVYGTYTDSSNYVRAALSSSSTAVTLAAETAGTGADVVDLVLTSTGLITTAQEFKSSVALYVGNDVGIGSGSFSADLQGVALGNGFGIKWSNDAYRWGTKDAGLMRNAAGVVEVNNGTAGTFRDLKLRNLLAGGGNGSYVQTPSMTVANLAAAGTAGAGARAFVTDATATTFLSTVAGGGSNKVPVVSDGTNWLIG